MRARLRRSVVLGPLPALEEGHASSAATRVENRAGEDDDDEEDEGEDGVGEWRVAECPAEVVVIGHACESRRLFFERKVGVAIIERVSLAGYMWR